MCVLHKQFGELRLFVFQMYIWSQNLVLAFAFVWCEPVWLHLVRSSSMGLKQFAKQKFQTLSIQLGLDCISASYIYIYIYSLPRLVGVNKAVCGLLQLSTTGVACVQWPVPLDRSRVHDTTLRQILMRRFVDFCCSPRHFVGY